MDQNQWYELTNWLDELERLLRAILMEIEDLKRKK
jgi:hypothetical protein